MNEDFWKTVEGRHSYSNKSRRTGVLNVALLFGTAVIALSLIITPMLAGKSATHVAQFSDNYDMISTGSIKKTDTGKTYSIRRSITQPMPEMPCVVTGYSNESGC
jgi:hypothetical protein